jgi:hypothetical protein
MSIDISYDLSFTSSYQELWAGFSYHLKILTVEESVQEFLASFQKDEQRK